MSISEIIILGQSFIISLRRAMSSSLLLFIKIKVHDHQIPPFFLILFIDNIDTLHRFLGVFKSFDTLFQDQIDIFDI